MLILAHRGYSAKYPENTLAAFRGALAHGAQAIELDVHFSKDRKLVVTHDFEFGRTVQAQGNTLDYTALELSRLDAGSFKGSQFSSEGVAGLDTVLNCVRGRCLLNIEVKHETLTSDQDRTEAAAALSHATAGMLPEIVFSSFDPLILGALRSTMPSARLAFLDGHPESGLKHEHARTLGCEFYNTNLHRVTGAQILALQGKGLKVLLYTVRTPSDIALAQDLAPDGVFADNLEDALNLV